MAKSLQAPPALLQVSCLFQSVSQECRTLPVTVFVVKVIVITCKVSAVDAATCLTL